MGVLRTKLSALPDAKKINLIILSDHGMGAVSPERYINIKSVVPERMIASISGGNPVYLINPSEGKKDSVLYLLNKSKGLKAWRNQSFLLNGIMGLIPVSLKLLLLLTVPGVLVPDLMVLLSEAVLMDMIIQTPICFQFSMLQDLHSKKIISLKNLIILIFMILSAEFSISFLQKMTEIRLI